MIVADTNLIAYLLIPGVSTAAARAVLARDDEWAVPSFWQSEFRNILALYVRQRLLSLDDALTIYGEAAGLIRGREYAVDPTSVLRLASESGCTAYDAEFVHVAQTLAAPLVTSDKKLLQLFPGVAVSPEAFATSPASEEG